MPIAGTPARRTRSTIDMDSSPSLQNATA